MSDYEGPVTIYPPPGRCPNWSPGGELKCEGELGHEDECKATRHGGGITYWVGAKTSNVQIVREYEEWKL